MRIRSFRKQQKITNVQNEKLDEYETARLSAMAEMKFVESQLQSFDIQAKPSITHTQIGEMQKVSWTKRSFRRRVSFRKELDNARCEYEILQQKMAHWMPCDEPVRSNRCFSPIVGEEMFSLCLDNRQFNDESGNSSGWIGTCHHGRALMSHLLPSSRFVCLFSERLKKKSPCMWQMPFKWTKSAH